MAGVVNTCRCLYYTTFGQGFRNSGGQFFFTVGTEIHAAEQLVSEVSAFEVEMAFEKVKRHKSPGIYQIPAELIEGGGSKISCDNSIHEEIKSRLKSGNACYHSVQNLLCSSLLSKNVKVKIYICICIYIYNLHGCLLRV
jgi:hypothetical protein